MATPRRSAIKAQKQTAQILEAIQILVTEIAGLKTEIAELKDALAAKPARGRPSAKK